MILRIVNPMIFECDWTPDFHHVTGWDWIPRDWLKQSSYVIITSVHGQITDKIRWFQYQWIFQLFMLMLKIIDLIDCI